MSDSEIVAAAWTAAASRDFYPEPGTEVIEGDKATVVLMCDKSDNWIICAHRNRTPRTSWHTTQILPEGQARALALTYAKDGVP